MSFEFWDKGRAFRPKPIPVPRPGKGDALCSPPESFVCLDTETTGLSPCRDAIIDIGAIRVVNGEVTGKYQTMIDPGMEIPPFITRLTGISTEMVRGQPTEGEAIAKLLAFIGDFPIVGHNVHFDVNFIYEACRRQNFPIFRNDYYDTLQLSRALYPFLPNHKLCTLIRYLDVADAELHRALSDAEQTLACLRKMLLCMDGAHDEEDIAKIRCVSDAEGAEAALCRCADARFSGLTFVFTGELQLFSREEAGEIVALHGGRVTGSISGKTSFLVVGSAAGSKLKKAQELGIRILREDEFIRICKGSEAALQ